MTLAARHLKDRRPRKDRDVTWSRRRKNVAVFWTFWRRDSRNVLHSLSRAFLECEDVSLIANDLLEAKRELRNFVDEIDLEAMEETA